MGSDIVKVEMYITYDGEEYYVEEEIDPHDLYGGIGDAVAGLDYDFRNIADEKDKIVDTAKHLLEG